MRVARLTVPGSVHHIISRFLDRRWLIGDDESRQQYVKLVGRAFECSDWRWLGYAVMSNHTHHTAIAGRTPPEHWLKRAHSPFAHWLNARNDGLGPVFAQRPTILVVGDADVARVLAYVHNNPVRANVVPRAADAPAAWTSQRAYLGLESPPPGLDVIEGLRRCGYAADADGRRAFGALVDERAADQEDRLEMEHIRRKAREFGQVELGTPIVGDEIAVPIVARPYARVRLPVDPRELVAIVARVLGVSSTAMTERTHAGAERRRIAILAGQVHGLSIAATSQALGISAQAGSKLVGSPDRIRAALATLERLNDAIEKYWLTKLRPSPEKLAKEQEKGRPPG